MVEAVEGLLGGPALWECLPPPRLLRRHDVAQIEHSDEWPPLDVLAREWLHGPETLWRRDYGL